jgi:hypothetical protein
VDRLRCSTSEGTAALLDRSGYISPAPTSDDTAAETSVGHSRLA